MSVWCRHSLELAPFGIIVTLAQSARRQPSTASPSNAIPSRSHRCLSTALNAREPPGCPQRLTRCVVMWCDAQRRVVERCDAPRRAALPTVMSISPTRPIDWVNMAGPRATSRQRCCRSRHLFRSRRKGRDCPIAARLSLICWIVVLREPRSAGRTVLNMVRFAEMSLKGRMTCQTQK